MGLEDRDYMQPDFVGRRPPGIWARLRFALWLLTRRLNGGGARKGALNAEKKKATKKSI